MGASNKTLSTHCESHSICKFGAICCADATDSARPLPNSVKNVNVKVVYNYMVCNYIYKSISRSEIIFVRCERQQITLQNLK